MDLRYTPKRLLGGGQCANIKMKIYPLDSSNSKEFVDSIHITVHQLFDTLPPSRAGKSRDVVGLTWLLTKKNPQEDSAPSRRQDIDTFLGNKK